jgi:predicted short-subunit dehydrogenase-like oxidoreductase (DUF2520 family)
VSRRPKISIVGAGNLATALAGALREQGYQISEIIVRAKSMRGARTLAAKVAARAVTLEAARLDSDLLWVCVPDREIRVASAALAKLARSNVRLAFHSSGALSSQELASLHKRRISVAAVHPLMTFVPGTQPALHDVPFALEGDKAALQLARRVVRDLGGESFSLHRTRKPAYHAWATLTSPLLVAFLVAIEKAGAIAGLSRKESRRLSKPIIRQTLQNYWALGPERSFSGPIIRGDSAVVAKHLAIMRRHPEMRDVYIALARIALGSLPVSEKKRLKRLL